MASTIKVGITATDEGFKSTMDQMKQSANSFGSSLDKTSKQSQTLNGALREAKKEAMNLAMAYEQLDAAAKASDFGQQLKAQLDQALQAAGQLQDIKSDVQANIKNLASDTMVWDATAQGIGVVSSGLQGLASAYGLVGGNTEKFAQALVAVNAVQSVSNTIIGIGNALQKQSALMVGLRAAKNAIFGASEVAATTAETANTAATTANTTATAANTAAKGANAAANVGQTAATTAATTAQLANNAAVLANPYVLCAAAVVALTAAIVAWCVSMDDATQEELALDAATEALEAELDNTMKTAGDQISTFMTLKKTYDECGGNVDVLKKKIIDNTEAQRKLGVTVKTVDDVHRLFGRNSQNYCDWAYARATAMAAEAAQAAILGEVLAELTKIQAKMMRGEEVDYVDFEKILKKGGLSSVTINKLVKEAGGDVEWDYIWENLDASKMDWGKFMGSAVKEMMENGVGKPLQDVINEATSKMDVASADFSDMLEKNNKTLGKTAKGHKDNAKAAKGTTNEIEKTLNSLAGCDAIIQEADKNMKNLKSTSKTYAQDLEKMKGIILTARLSKLSLLDKTTIEGLSQAKKLIEDIMKDLPSDSPSLENLRKQLNNVNNQLYGMYAALAKNGDPKSLKSARSQVEAIMQELPAGSDELRTWAAIWREINEKIVTADTNLENLKKGIQKGSKTEIEQRIKQLQTEINNLDLSIDGNMNIAWSKQLEISDLKAELGRINETLGGVETTVVVPIDYRLDYKKSPMEKIERDIDYYQKRLQDLQKVTEESVSPEKYKEVQAQINEIQQTLGSLNKQHVFLEMTEDVKTYNEELQKASYDSFKGAIDGLHTIYNVASELPDKLDECENGFEAFFEVLDAGFSIIDSIMSFIENIEKVIQLMDMLTGAKDALSASTAKNTTVTATNTAVTEGAAAAQQMKAGADAQEASAAIGNAAANTAEASSEATSQMSSMGPFGWIAGIAAALAIAGALFGIISQAKGYATGGIIGGSTTMGDNVLARVNAGEMILNQRQQSNLFDMINKGTLDTAQSQPSISTVKVKGSDLYLALNNYSKITKNTLK